MFFEVLLRYTRKFKIYKYSSNHERLFLSFFKFLFYLFYTNHWCRQRTGIRVRNSEYGARCRGHVTGQMMWLGPAARNSGRWSLAQWRCWEGSWQTARSPWRKEKNQNKKEVQGSWENWFPRTEVPVRT